MCVVFVTVGWPQAALAADSTHYNPDRSRGNGVAIPFEGFVGRDGGPIPVGGAVGVDLVLGSTAQPYLPCQNAGSAPDTYINACQVRGSYTTFVRFGPGGGLLFPHGYFMPNTQPDYVRGGQVQTDWGARTAGLSVELYPNHDYDTEYVHSRFYIDRFDHKVNGWTYSADVGRIRLVTLADPGTTQIGGSLTDGGQAPAAGRVKVVIFGGAARSTTGHPISSFSVHLGTGGSTWTSGAMYAGPQQITVTDTANGHECVIRINHVPGPDYKVDLDVSRPGFGHSGARCNF